MIATAQFTISAISDGAQGVSVANVIPEYRLSDSSTEMTGSGQGYSWSTTKPSIGAGQYLWSRQRNVMSDGTTSYSEAVCDIVMSGLVFDVDQNTQAISQKVWQSDISNSINQYDQSTGAAIRDRVTATETDLSGIHTTISQVQTTVASKADGSTVTNLSSQVNTISDTVNGHTQAISATNTRINNLKVGATNLIANSEFLNKTKSPYISTTATPNTSYTKDNQVAYDTGTQAKIVVAFPPLLSGEQYVFSYDWCRPWGAQTLRTTIGGENYDITTVNDSNWHRNDIVFTANATTTLAEIYITAGTVNYTLYARHFQLEKGNLASEWYPAREDFESEVNATKTIAEQTADHLSWIINENNMDASTFTFKSRVMELVNADLVIKDPAGSATIISGGKINANSITTNMLATNAIKSTNYVSGAQSSDTPPYSAANNPYHYSTMGTFMDLANGNIYSPNFSLINSAPTGSSVDVGAYFNGTIIANQGLIGDDIDSNAYWQIGTINDENWDTYAGLIAHGNALIQADKLTMMNNLLSSYNSGNFVKIGNTWYDFGFSVPTAISTQPGDPVLHTKDFLYIRSINSKPTSDTPDTDWTYLFRVQSNGDIYWNGSNIASGTYLPLSGGTISGSLTVSNNLTVNGSISGTASAAQKLSSAKNLNVSLSQTSNDGKVGFDGSNAVTIGVTGTLGVGNGGTGATSFTSGNVLVGNGSGAIQTRAIRNNTAAGALGWTSSSADTTLVTTNTIAYWDGRYQTTNNASNIEYVKLGKLGTVVTHDITDFITTSGGEISGTLTVDEIDTGNIVVTGAARFTRLYGELLGNASTATKVNNAIIIKINSGTTEGTNMFTYDGSAAKTINITKSAIGLGNVENTALSTWAGSSNLTTTKVGTLASAATKGVDTSISDSSTSGNLPTSQAVASFVEGKGYVTSSGVTSVRVQATSPVVSSVNTAQTSTLNTTISLADAYGDTKNPYGNKNANTVLAGPSSGSAAAPSFRALVAADIPSLTKSKISDFPTTWALSNVSGADDLKAIEELTGTSGMLKKTAANTWALTTVVSNVQLNNDVLTITKSDGTSDNLTINITGQVVSGATILSDSNGNPISLGSASAPVYFSNGVPAQANTIPTIALNGSTTTSPSFYAPTGVGTTGQYLKSSGSGAPTWETFSKSTVGLGNVANLDQSKAIKSITKSGGTYTATALDNTTFTFSESVTGVKGDAESSYRTGNINLTAHNVGAIAYNDAIFSTNTFASNIYKGLYISKIDNAFFALDKRYTVTATYDGNNIADVAQFFDGNYEGNSVHIEDGKSAVITIDFGTKFAGYPYGYIYISFYNYCTPSSITGRVYNNYESQGVGWKAITFEQYDRGIFMGYQGYYGLQILEITIVGSSDTPYGYTSPTEIEFRPTRPEPYAHNPIVTKYCPQTLYYDLTAPNFIGNLSGTATKATQDGDGAVISSTYAKLSGATFTGAITVPTMKVNSIINEGDSTRYTHRIDFGGSNFNHMDFYEYGGVYNFYKNTAYPGTDSVTLLGKITINGWEGNVVGNLTGTASKATADGNGLNIASNYAKLSGATFTGGVSGTSFAASSYLAANSGNSGTAGGLSLWSTNPMDYGIAMRTTSSQVKHGYVQGDLATYFTMTGTSVDNSNTRGWIFKNSKSSTAVASISGDGNVVFNGSITVGGNSTNTSGIRLVYDSTLSCLNFTFI